MIQPFNNPAAQKEEEKKDPLPKADKKEEKLDGIYYMWAPGWKPN